MQPVMIRMTRGQKRMITKAAKEAGRGFSEHVRHVCGVVYKQCGHATTEDCDCAAQEAGSGR